MKINIIAKIRIKKSCLEETLLLALYGFYVLLAHWIWFGRGIQETVMILLSLVVLGKSLKNRRISIKQLVDCLLWISLFVICLIGIVQAESHEYLAADLKAMVGTVLVATAVIAAIRKLTGSGVDCLNFLFSFLNGYVVINDIIIVIQYFVPFFLMNTVAIRSVNNGAYFDQLTGFFGINGTTRWDLWTVALIILNFYIGFSRKNKKIIRYNLVLFFASALICMLNSARSFLIIAPATTLTYLFLIRKIHITKRVKQVILVLMMLFLAFTVYLVNPYVNHFVNDLITDKVAIYFSGDVAYMVAANDDRAVATYYAVENGRILGAGIGSIAMHSTNIGVTSTNKVVKYMGLNSASSYIYMVGIAGYFLWALCLARCGVYGKKGNTQRTTIFFLYLLILSYLLPIYSSAPLLPAIMLIFYIFDLEMRKK